MNYVKLVLLFQAVITLIIGFVFLSQTISPFSSESKELSINFNELDKFTDSSIHDKIEEIKNRFLLASFILIVIGLIEILLISRLIS